MSSIAKFLYKMITIFCAVFNFIILLFWYFFRVIQSSYKEMSFSYRRKKEISLNDTIVVVRDQLPNIGVFFRKLIRMGIISKPRILLSPPIAHALSENDRTESLRTSGPAITTGTSSPT